MKNIRVFFIWKFSVFGDEISVYLNRRVFIMDCCKPLLIIRPEQVRMDVGFEGRVAVQVMNSLFVLISLQWMLKYYCYK